MPPSNFKVLSEIFKKTGVSPVLIGGYAVNSYKVTRHTADIDFLITRDDFKKIEKDLLELGYKKSYEQDLFVQLTGTSEMRDIDFMLGDPLTVEKLASSGMDITIAGEHFIVPSLYNLIALKLHSIKYNAHRELTDLPDVVNLIQAHHNTLDMAELKAVFDKFGTVELYEKTVKLLGKEIV